MANAMGGGLDSSRWNDLYLWMGLESYSYLGEVIGRSRVLELARLGVIVGYRVLGGSCLWSSMHLRSSRWLAMNSSQELVLRHLNDLAGGHGFGLES